MKTRLAHLSDIHFGSEAVGSAARLAEALNDALEALAELRVDLVLAGHLHRTYAADHTRGDTGHTVTAVQAGTALSSRVRGEANSFNHIEIDRGMMTVWPMALDGETIWQRSAKPLRVRQAEPSEASAYSGAPSAKMQSPGAVCACSRRARTMPSAAN